MAVLLPRLATGGAEHLVLAAARELRRRGRFAVAVCALEGTPQPTPPAWTDVGVETFATGHRYDPRGAVRLARFVRRRGIELVHAHLFPAMLAGAIVAARYAVPLVVTEHSTWNRRRRGWLRAVDRFVYGRATRIVCVSQAVADALHAWLPATRRATEVVPNGVPVHAPGSRGAPRADLLLVGNLDRPAKGVDVLLRALATMPAPRPTAIVVGEGALRSDLEATRDRLGLRDTVVFAGRVPAAPYLTQVRALVVPSRWEGLPLAMLEAMERGLPVVASRVGGIPDVVEPSGAGILVPPGEPAALAAALQTLLADEALQRRLSGRARATVCARYDIARHVDALERVYADVLASTTVPGRRPSLPGPIEVPR